MPDSAIIKKKESAKDRGIPVPASAAERIEKQKRPTVFGLFFALIWKMLGFFVKNADISWGFYWNFREKTAVFQL
ncbi:MAG: hypothetical protein E7431_01895 [Ruminococcaceae bacterium]|nr:hypothetical protein [Oscillospiraceae bacterium]